MNKTLPICMLSIVTTLSAQAQVGTESAARAAREFRRDAKDTRDEWSLKRMGPALEAAERSVTLGVAYERPAGGGGTLATPFSLDYTTAGPKMERWTFQFTGDGYVHVRQPGAPSVDGVGDLALKVFRPLSENLTGMLGVGIPTHGDVGSTEWMQQGMLIYSAEISTSWAYAVIGRVAHQRRDEPGVSAWSQRLYGELDYALGDNRFIGLSLARSHRSGLGGTTDVGLLTGFPVGGKSKIALSLGRVLTKGARATSVGADLTVSF